MGYLVSGEGVDQGAIDVVDGDAERHDDDVLGDDRSERFCHKESWGVSHHQRLIQRSEVSDPIPGRTDSVQFFLCQYLITCFAFYFYEYIIEKRIKTTYLYYY